MGLQDRIRKLEGKGPGDCQLCGISHPVVVVRGESVPTECPGCGGPPVVVLVPNEEGREWVNRLLSGELPEPRTENEEKEGAN